MDELEITEKIESILLSAVKCSLHLNLREVKSVIQYCFPHVTEKNTIIKIVQFIRNLGDNMLLTEQTRKHPVILVIHDVSIATVIKKMAFATDK